MPNPSINTSAMGVTNYMVSNSKGVIADLLLNIADSPTFRVKYPSSAMNPQITLFKGGTSLALLPGPIDDNNATFPTRRVQVATPTPDGMGNLSLTCTISATSAAMDDEAWQVRVSATNPVAQYEFSQPDNNVADLTITRLMCDP